jgi:hypothetical protein
LFAIRKHVRHDAGLVDLEDRAAALLEIAGVGYVKCPVGCGSEVVEQKGLARKIL